MKVASEGAEQSALFQWAGLAVEQYPDLAWMFHIPNGGSRNKAEAARLKAEGVKAGVADIFLPSPKGKYHGLFIEMKKADRSNHASERQKAFLAFADAKGYCSRVCYGWDEARTVIENYLQGIID